MTEIDTQRPPGLLLIRADASSEIGIGHVMRTLALAQAWQDQGGRVLYLMAPPPEALKQRLLRASCALRLLEPHAADDPMQVLLTARVLGAVACVVDGYAFDASYQQILTEAGLPVLWIDDEAHAAPYTAPVILNQNPHATPHAYHERPDHATLLLGLRHALLRREFAQAQPLADVPDGAPRVVVTFGGSDAAGLTQTAWETLHAARILHPDLKADLILGPAYAGPEAWLHDVEATPWATVHRAVEDLVPLLRPATVALAAAGSTTWELARLGVPSLLLTVAPNQQPIAQAAEKAGIAWTLGEVGDLDSGMLARVLTDALTELLGDPSAQATMRAAGPPLVDGGGAQRVVESLLQVIATDPYGLHAESQPAGLRA